MNINLWGLTWLQNKIILSCRSSYILFLEQLYWGTIAIISAHIDIKLHIFDVYNLIHYDVFIYPWKHHHNQDSEHMHYPQKSSLASVVTLFCTPWYFLPQANWSPICPYIDEFAFLELYIVEFCSISFFCLILSHKYNDVEISTYCWVNQ